MKDSYYITHNIINHLLGIFFLTILVFIAYSSSLNGIWALDDVLVNQPIGTEGLIEKIGARKLAYLSFVANQNINPYDPVNFRIFNIVIHILNSTFVYIIAFLTLRLPHIRERFKLNCYFVALISATIFALHPLNINAVAYIIQRMASLAALFVLLSLISYILANRAYRLYLKILLYSLTVIFVILGILSKENAVMALPLLLLYDYVFLSGYNKKVFLWKVIIIVSVGVVALFIAGLFIPIHKVALDIVRISVDFDKPLLYRGWMATDVYWSPIEHFLTEFRVVCRYLFIFMLPLPGFLVFDWWGYPVSKGLFEPVTTFFSVLFLLAALTFSILKIKRFPFLSFGILWYFIAISLESFFAIGSDLYFEHRNYLPLAGLVFGLTAQVVPVLEKRIRWRYGIWIVFIALSLTLGFLTFQRNFIWKDPVTFWNDTVQKIPYNLRGLLALGNSYRSMADFQNAKRVFQNSIKIAMERKSPYFTVESLYNLGFTYLLFEKKADAGSVIDSFEMISPNSYKIKILKGFYSYLNQDLENALKNYMAVLNGSGNVSIYDRVTIYTLLGDTYRDMGLTDKALDTYRDALRINHSFPAAYHGIAKVQMMKKDFTSALDYLSKVIEIDPHNFKALSDIAHLIIIKGEGADRALPFAERAILLKPPFYQPYLIMGTILTVKGEDRSAKDYYQKASDLNAPDYLVLFNMSWAYSLKGDSERQRYYLIELLKLNNIPDNIRKTAEKILSGLKVKKF